MEALTSTRWNTYHCPRRHTSQISNNVQPAIIALSPCSQRRTAQYFICVIYITTVSAADGDSVEIYEN